MEFDQDETLSSIKSEEAPRRSWGISYRHTEYQSPFEKSRVVDMTDDEGKDDDSYPFSLRDKTEESVYEQSESSSLPLFHNTPSDGTRRPLSQPRTVHVHAHLSLFMPITLAVVLAVGQHLFFRRVQGHRVTNRLLSEFWIRNAGSAIATLAASLMSSSITYTFTQLLWFFVRRYPFTLSNLDLLFSGPSNWTMSKLLFSKIKPLPSAVFFAAMACVQALVFVTIFTPNALSIGLPPMQRSSLALRVLDLSLLVDNEGENNQTIVTHAVAQALTDGSMSFTPPSGCGLGCQYTLAYQAPALRCQNIPNSDISDGSEETVSSSTQAMLLRSLGVLYNATRASLDNPGITVAYAQSTTLLESNRSFVPPPVPQPLAAVGSICTVEAASYSANFSFNASTGAQLVSTTITAYSGALNFSLFADSAAGAQVPNIQLFAYWSNQIFDMLFDYVGGILCGYGTAESPTCPKNVLYSNVLELPLLSDHIDMAPNGTTTITLSPGEGVSSNFSRALEDLFGIAVLAFSSEFSSPTTVDAMVQDSEPVYFYKSETLIITYALALSLTVGCAIVGLMCMKADGVPGSTDFSQILVTTRGADIDRLVSGSEAGNAYLTKSERHVRLRFDGSGARPGFRPIDWSGE